MGRHSDARERLVRSAAELWHTRSYQDVGVSEICAHAGVQKGSFYHFFESKRDLALAVIDDSWERLGVGMMMPIRTGPLPPLQRLVAWFQAGMQEQLDIKEATGVTVGCSFGNLTVELATVDEVVRERLCRLFEDWAAAIQGTLDDAVAAGELPPDVDTARAARALLAYIEGLGVLIKAHDDPLSVEDILPLAFRLIGADPAAVPVPATAPAGAR